MDESNDYNIQDDMMFNASVSPENAACARELLAYAYNMDAYDNDAENKPWGYVYASRYADGSVYIGKRKIYAGTKWMHYVGSGANLNPHKVIRKEFICFGWTREELHALECKCIQETMDYYDSIGEREKVLNERVYVVDSAAHSRNDFQEFEEKYGLIPVYLYLEFGSGHAVADYMGCSYRMVYRMLVKYGIKNFHEAEHEYNLETTPSTFINIVKSDNGKKYECICKQCGNVYNTKDKNSKFCSRECQLQCNSILSETDIASIVSMLSSGMSLRQIGRVYGTSAVVIRNFAIRNSIELPSTKANKDNSNAGRWSAHMKWHVRRNKPDMDNCEYCKKHEGFEEESMIMQDERTRPCMNPYCNNMAVGRTIQTCSDECKHVYSEIISSFSSHISAHLKKGYVKEYCYYCQHPEINNIMNMDKQQVRELADNLLAMDDKLLKTITEMRADRNTIAYIADTVGITRDKVRAYLKGERALKYLREHKSR